MTVPMIDSAVGELLDAFAQAAPDRLDTAFRALAGALWNDGEPTGPAPHAVPELVRRMDEVGDDRVGHLAVLLGLLVETEPPENGGAIAAAVHDGLDRFLELVGRGAAGRPSTLALVYLLAHFPGDRDRVLAAVEPVGLDVDDQTRLQRALDRLDPENPDLGRCWPSPAVWSLSDTERDFDQSWIKDLTPEQIAANWENDTKTVLGYAGAKAYWAVRYGPVGPDAPSEGVDVVEPAPIDPGADLFGPHAAALRCTSCRRGRLEVRAGAAQCTGCRVTYPIAGGVLDLSARVSAVGVGAIADEAADEATADLLHKLAEMPSMGVYYESVLRPSFLRIAGANWGGEVTLADEDAYIARSVRPVDGPVLDMAAGAGRWTAVLAETVGAERLVALDMGVPMLTVLRRRLPRVPAVLASALDLPFEDASLGAIMCWNALQAFPDDAATAVAEAGRCLRPGGTFTVMTFRFDPDPIARHFQAAHYFPSRPEGMLLFEPEELRRWFADAGMTIRDETERGTFVFITAERTA